MTDWHAEYRRVMAARDKWLAGHLDIATKENPISRLEYDLAERDSEGMALAWGICRCCGEEVVVHVIWDESADSNLMPMSAGRGDRCAKPRCGESMCADFSRMCLEPYLTGTETEERFIDLCYGIEVAKQNDDAVGERMQRETLAAVRAAQNLIERAAR